MGKKKVEKKIISENKAKQLISKLQKTSLKRPEIRQSLQYVIWSSISKLDNKWTKNSEKLAWGRILVSACSSATILLRDSEIEEIKAEIEDLKKRATAYEKQGRM